MRMRDFVDDHLIIRHLEARKNQTGFSDDFLSFYIREIHKNRESEKGTSEVNGEYHLDLITTVFSECSLLTLRKIAI